MLSNYTVQYTVVAKPCYAGDVHQRFSIKELIVHTDSEKSAMNFFLAKNIQFTEASVKKSS
jgi:hypothetical protein